MLVGKGHWCWDLFRWVCPWLQKRFGLLWISLQLCQLSQTTDSLHFWVGGLPCLCFAGPSCRSCSMPFTLSLVLRSRRRLPSLSLCHDVSPPSLSFFLAWCLWSRPIVVHPIAIVCLPLMHLLTEALLCLPLFLLRSTLPYIGVASIKVRTLGFSQTVNPWSISLVLALCLRTSFRPLFQSP